ncbi:MAG: hypothetical protein RSE58_10655 [Clostridia bacterium]
MNETVNKYDALFAQMAFRATGVGDCLPHGHTSAKELAENSGTHSG